MNTRVHQRETFSLSLAILNLDIHSPVLFLHILVNPQNKHITGNCDVSTPHIQSSRLYTTEIFGKYSIMGVKQDEIEYLVNLDGYLSFDQSTPDIKITMLIKHDWKEGKVYYKYKKNNKWVSVIDVHLKIKSTQPLVTPISILDLPGGSYTPTSIA